MQASAAASRSAAQSDSATEWLLLRGLVREQGHWGEFPQQLQAQLGVPVRCVDLPGNGERYADSSPTDLRALLEAVRASLPVGRRVLLGLSMGGLLAAEWASQYPDEVAGVVMINSSFGALSRPWQRMRPSALPLIMRALLAHSTEREALLYRLTCADHADRTARIQAWIAIAQCHPVSRANFLRQLLAAARYQGPAQPPACPALILSSQGDGLVNPSCSAAIAAHWQCARHLHPWAGHDLPHDDPDWVLQQVAQLDPDAL